MLQAGAASTREIHPDDVGVFADAVKDAECFQHLGSGFESHRLTLLLGIR